MRYFEGFSTSVEKGSFLERRAKVSFNHNGTFFVSNLCPEQQNHHFHTHCYAEKNILFNHFSKKMRKAVGNGGPEINCSMYYFFLYLQFLGLSSYTNFAIQFV